MTEDRNGIAWESIGRVVIRGLKPEVRSKFVVLSDQEGEDEYVKRVLGDEISLQVVSMCQEMLKHVKAKEEDERQVALNLKKSVEQFYMQAGAC